MLNIVEVPTKRRKVLNSGERMPCNETGCSSFQGTSIGEEIQTDHRLLEWVDQLKDSNTRLCRWSFGLQPYQYTFVQRPDKVNSIATNKSVAGNGKRSVEDGFLFRWVNPSMKIDPGVRSHWSLQMRQELRSLML